MKFFLKCINLCEYLYRNINLCYRHKILFSFLPNYGLCFHIARPRFKCSHKCQSRSRRDTRLQVQVKKIESISLEYVYFLPFYSPPSTISSCRNTWSSAQRRCPARPKRIVCIRLVRNCCPPQALTCNPIHSRPRNFTVS